MNMSNIVSVAFLSFRTRFPSLLEVVLYISNVLRNGAIYSSIII